MKLITAIIRSYQLDQVRESLIAAGIERITVSRAAGHGQQKKEEFYRGVKVIPGLTPKMRVEIAVNEEFVETTVNAIISAARSAQGKDGDIGDGKIFITNLEECIRIRTGERGGSAI
ncbi:nitrogen regulatory protein P-II family [Breznakibacter xylanolyticus]|uniref:Nitrogen regulatory protein P-II family n=1 Tax=Breznakibacter xylanolyticus TaxID=990 RepID=A0A2W7N2X0_9BACT|nr:P-II family nitrogen regulator [Breznakibacter xylanolyticus]MBN2743239.1 P-II family nitrogen regulator [Marinilabiliaceae bacterium]PZX14401.1 nitrogen regulatory protein P-II family [Breznakibacter xylanolyticus]